MSIQSAQRKHWPGCVQLATSLVSGCIVQYARVRIQPAACCTGEGTEAKDGAVRDGINGACLQVEEGAQEVGRIVFCHAERAWQSRCMLLAMVALQVYRQ